VFWFEATWLEEKLSSDMLRKYCDYIIPCIVRKLLHVSDLSLEVRDSQRLRGISNARHNIATSLLIRALTATQLPKKVMKKLP